MRLLRVCLYYGSLGADYVFLGLGRAEKKDSVRFTLYF